MDQEQLKKTIAEYFVKLPKEAQEAFSSMEWMEILKNLSIKYNINPKEIETLGTETTLVLLGIISIDEYYDNLDKELNIEKDTKNNLLIEIDQNIFKNIKSQLIKIYELNVLSLDKNNDEIKPLIFDPRFSNMPKDVQEAIAHSNWKENLYKIAQKYKLSIVQMGDLEEITAKVIANVIPSDKYENELAFRIIISKNDISSIVSDVNKDILMEIRKLLKEKWEDKSIKNVDEIPLPPYANIIKNEELGIKNLDKKEKESTLINIDSKNNIIVKETKPIDIPEKKIEIKEEIQIPKPVAPLIDTKEAQKELESIIKTIPFPTKKENEDKKIIEQIKTTPKISEIPEVQPINIMEEKLKGITSSNNKVTDYSMPKINTPSSHSNDPYREAI